MGGGAWMGCWFFCVISVYVPKLLNLLKITLYSACQWSWRHWSCLGFFFVPSRHELILVVVLVYSLREYLSEWIFLSVVFYRLYRPMICTWIQSLLWSITKSGVLLQISCISARWVTISYPFKVGLHRFVLIG